MKKLPLFLFIAAIGVVVYLLFFTEGGSIKIPLDRKTETSEKSVKSKRGLQNFEKIEITGVFEVDVTYGSTERVEIDAPNHIKKRLRMKVKSNTLYFELDKGATSPYAAGKVKVHITTAKLNSFTLSGASSIQLNNPLKDDTFTLHSSGASKFSGDINVEMAEIKLEGAAKTDLSGKAWKGNLELSGGSKLNDYDFEVTQLNVILSGASSVKISGVNSIEGSMSGASSLDYEGRPVVKMLEMSGASKLNQH